MNLFHPARRWPTLITAALLGNLGLGVILIRVANADRHFAVEPDYYRKAVEWDSTRAQERRNVALGWQVAPDLGAVDGRTDPELAVVLSDASGAPIADAIVTMEAFQVAHAADRLTARLHAGDAPGRYLARVPMRRTGLWELRLAVSRGATRFTATVRLDADSAAAARVVRERPGEAASGGVAAVPR